MIISSSRECGGYYLGNDVNRVAQEYYKTLREAVASGVFDVIGHLDIYRRHGTRYLGEALSDIYREHIDDVFSLMLKTNTGLEINTSSLRYGQGNFYPGVEILMEAVKRGIGNFTVGSDCHRLNELGQGVKEAFLWAAEHGINISVYNKRKPTVLLNEQVLLNDSKK